MLEINFFGKKKRAVNDAEEDEGTPLIPNAKPKRTPLPKLQIAILMILQFCEPIESHVIYPFINQLISELGVTGGDQRKVGYYAGLIESLFFASESLTVLQWSRASDHIGRKPVLLIGLVGMTLAMLLFGLSRTFWGLVISRCLSGLLNGNVGVMKSMIGELTDSTNVADGFALLPVVWAVGSTLGPFLGGTLAKPSERFPRYFDTPFWRRYPYFLPCAASAGIIFFCTIITIFFLKETNKRGLPNKPSPPSSFVEDSETAPLILPNRTEDSTVDGPVPLSKLLNSRIIFSVASYAVIAFLEITLCAIQPLFYSTATKYGGLGFSPATIGVWLAVMGCSIGVFQALFFPPIVRRFGSRNVFVTAVCSFVINFSIFPVMAYHTRRYGVTNFVRALLFAQLCCGALMDMGFGCAFVFITASAPNKRSLGATNGLSQTTVAIARTIGPVTATSMFAFSVEHNILGGNAVFVVMVALSVLGLIPVMNLPEEPWVREDECVDEIRDSD